MNVLDRCIGWFAPRAGLARAAARDMLRGYTAGANGRLQQGWTPHRGSQNAALEAGRGLMVSRSRDLGRNNEWMAAALRRLPAAMVGTGPTASPRGGKRVREQVLEDWRDFCENGDLEGQLTYEQSLALAARTVVEAGECFYVWERLPSSAGRRVPLGWRLLPPEYLDDTKMGRLDGGGAIRGGIEYDGRGKVLAYWFFDRHPHDAADLGGALRPRSTRYPAEAVDHVFERLWIGQRRGAPWLAPVAVSVDNLAQYETAALWKARMAASLGLTVENAGPAPSNLGAPSKDDAGRQLEQLAPGAILRLKPGEKASQITPPADENLLTFWRLRCHAIAAGLGLPFASLTGDLTNANYSSLREGKLLFWELLDCWQWLLVHAQVLRPAWRRFGHARYAAGRTSGGVLPGVDWSFPRRPWVDPLKDAKALELELDLGLSTWRDAVGARGEDAEQQLAEILSWKAKLEAAGIRLGRPNAAPGLGHNGGPALDGDDDDDADGGKPGGKAAKE